MKYLLMFMLANTYLSTPHPFHASIGQLDFNPKEKRIEIALKIFTDDVNSLLSSRSGTNLDFGTEKENSKAGSIFLDYLWQNFSVNVNGKSMPLTFVGREPDKEGVFTEWIYLEIDQIEYVKDITLNNSFMTDYYADQTNIFHININNSQKSVSLSKNNTQVYIAY